MRDVSGDACGVGQEEPRVKAAGATGRRDGAEDEAQGARRGVWQGEAGFLVQFTQGGGGKGGGLWRALGAGQRQAVGAKVGQARGRGVVIFGVNRAAGKDVFRRHEHRTRPALAALVTSTTVSPGVAGRSGNPHFSATALRRAASPTLW